MIGPSHSSLEICAYLRHLRLKFCMVYGEVPFVTGIRSCSDKNDFLAPLQIGFVNFQDFQRVIEGANFGSFAFQKTGGEVDHFGGISE